MAAATRTPEDVLSFWLGSLDQDGLAQREFGMRWYQKHEAFDREVREGFASSWEAIMEGKREPWLESARGRLAYVIVLDQFSRNMFRGRARAFAGDGRALGAAAQGIELGHDRELHG